MSDDRIPFSELLAAIDASLQRDGVSAEAAAVIASSHARCERDGALSHGVFRVPQYAGALDSGYLDGYAEPRVERAGPAFIRVDARNGFAQHALERARPAIMQTVAAQGVLVCAIHSSHHHSALWPDLEPFADAGLFAISSVTGGVPKVAPFGAQYPVLSTNPFAYAAPIAGARPLVVDFATSSMSFGDLTLAAKAGREVPAGTGVDAEGRATTDAAAIVEGGTLLPFGGHKGAALSIMVELLASAMTGGEFSLEAVIGKPEGAHSSRTGQFLLVIDPDRGRDGGFADRAATLVGLLREASVERLPADYRYRIRDEAETLGVPVTPLIRRLLDQEPTDQG